VWVCDRSTAEIRGSNSAGGHRCMSVVIAVCCQVEVATKGRLLVRRSPTDCAMSLCVIWKPQE
jgi:hypothetical protein